MSKGCFSIPQRTERLRRSSELGDLLVDAGGPLGARERPELLVLVEGFHRLQPQLAHVHALPRSPRCGGRGRGRRLAPCAHLGPATSSAGWSAGWSAGGSACWSADLDKLDNLIKCGAWA